MEDSEDPEEEGGEQGEMGLWYIYMAERIESMC